MIVCKRVRRYPVSKNSNSSNHRPLARAAYFIDNYKTKYEYGIKTSIFKKNKDSCISEDIEVVGSPGKPDDKSVQEMENVMPETWHRDSSTHNSISDFPDAGFSSRQMIPVITI